MKKIVNRTHRPLRIRLSQGRTLHLNPGHEGQIATGDAERPNLLEMVERGEIAILDAGQSAEASGPVGGGSSAANTHGHHPDTSSHHRGDR